MKQGALVMGNHNGFTGSIQTMRAIHERIDEASVKSFIACMEDPSSSSKKVVACLHDPSVEECGLVLIHSEARGAPKFPKFRKFRKFRKYPKVP